MTDTEKNTPKLLQEPTAPAPSECCGGGSCCPCVWDFYFEQKRLWLAQQRSPDAIKNHDGDKNA